MTDLPPTEPAPAPSPDGPAAAASRRVQLKHLAIVAAVAAVVYGAASGPYLLKPSPHFHFVDLAHSFLQGRLDTDTPRRAAKAEPLPTDPQGMQEAVDRHLLDRHGNSAGWNDWASYRVLTLKGGEVVKGVFPWKDQPGPRATEFVTLDGRRMVIDVARELKTGCTLARPWAPCDEVVHQVSFPPFPAVAMLPLAWIQGYRVNDVWVTLAFAVLSVVLFWVWLERLRREGLTAHDRRAHAWLVALFAFGSVAFYCSIRGEVWFTALVMGMTLHLAYLLAAQDARRPLLAGLLFGLGVATRTPLLYAGAFFVLEALFPQGKWLGGRGTQGLGAAAVKLGKFTVPALAIGLALAWFNYARWGNPTEFGHFYLLEGTRGPTREHGLFNFVFLNHNLGTALLNMPRLLSEPPFILVSRHGLGLLACMPALVTLIGCPPPPPDAQPLDPTQEARRRALGRHLLLSVVAVALPALFYQNDGWQQFGYRFAMDFLPPLMGAFALRVPRLTRTTKVLIALGILVQVFGAVTFGRMEQFYYD